ncbi:ATP-binding protein [Phenylobacterium sp.]|uniref:ATP-binding protein n=1 Tax=Phenylobacterium sp. TaxID=1871053 RepID=UPI00273552FC|nr:ATP-binding protein [Phenylobacterium sp.]MDP3658650.1 ATP-binding protein [Phenylobacterium sp.]
MALAVAVCAIATSTALRLTMLGARPKTAPHAGWLVFGGVVGGLGAWATHFIAMLAYDPGLATSFALSGTLGSLVIVVFAGAIAVLAAVHTPKPWNILAWGATFSAGVGAMHYIGMAALRVPGVMTWNPLAVSMSIAVGGLLAMSALWILEKAQTITRQFLCSAIMVMAICGLHFIGMMGLVISHDPTVAMPAEVLDHRLIAVQIVAVMGLLVLAGAATMWGESRAQNNALRLFRSVIDAMPQALAYFDAEHRLVLGNGAYRRELAGIGLVYEEGLTLREIMLTAATRGGGWAGWVEAGLERWADGPTTFDQETSDGRILRLESNRTDNGGSIVVFTDITDLTRQAEDLVVARDLSEAATRAKSSFLATMSHELRTPLNGVLGMAQAMAAHELSEPQRERLEVMQQSGKGLLLILNDVLDLAKIEAGKVELEIIEFDLAAAVAAPHSALAALAKEKGLYFDVSIDDAAQGTYRGDPARLRQIIYNLLANAVKFTLEGGVRVSIHRQGDVVEFVIADSGIGMTNEQVGRLFQRFVQADASTTRQFGGTGLGLAVSGDLTRLMGGAITVESTMGEGSRFTLTLPLQRLCDAGHAEPVRAAPAFDDLDLQILAAEDNATNRLVLKTLLEHAGVTPVIVEDGAQAVEAWAAGDWDVILMDVHMPVMDGVCATREIRRRELATSRPRTPIIAVTANAMAHHIEEYRMAGMDGHVSKPIDLALLLAAIDTALADAPALAMEA